MVKKKQNVCMDTDSFIVYIKANDIYKNTAEDVEIKFGTSLQVMSYTDHYQKERTRKLLA